MENKGNHQWDFTDKVWVSGGILSLILIVLLLFKALFSILLLVLAGILMAIYFHGCAIICLFISNCGIINHVQNCLPPYLMRNVFCCTACALK